MHGAIGTTWTTGEEIGPKKKPSDEGYAATAMDYTRSFASMRDRLYTSSKLLCMIDRISRLTSRASSRALNHAMTS